MFYLEKKYHFQLLSLIIKNYFNKQNFYIKINYRFKNK